MTREIHVDGTNALRRLGRESGDLVADQAWLLAAVRRIARQDTPPADATVHFDGFPRGGGYGGTEIDGVHVCFSGDREADEAIVESARRARRVQAVLVVTDDAELAGRVRQIGTSTIGVAAFFALPRPAAAPGRDHDENKPHVGGFTAADFGLPDVIDTDEPPES